MTNPDRELLDEQIAYYRARAGEYDATSTPAGDPLAEHAAAVRRRVTPLIHGRVLELAAGTGQWTGLLADHADELLVTDASREMLAINRDKMGEREHVDFEVRDALTVASARDWDLIFFGFFLSHVPPNTFDAFWRLLEGELRAGGRVVFVDEGTHFLWREDWIDEAAGIVRRTLSDGATHRAVKVLWRPRELQARLAELGWDALITTEGPFYVGNASLSPALSRNGR